MNQITFYKSYEVKSKANQQKVKELFALYDAYKKEFQSHVKSYRKFFISGKAYQNIIEQNQKK